MTRTTKVILGLLCTMAGVIPTGIFYVLTEDTSLRDPGMWVMLLIAGVAAFGIFLWCKRRQWPVMKQIVLGLVASYACLVVVLLGHGLIAGNLGDTVMWLLVIVLVGMPFMLPLFMTAFLGASIAFGWTGQASPGDGATA